MKRVSADCFKPERNMLLSWRSGWFFVVIALALAGTTAGVLWSQALPEAPTTADASEKPISPATSILRLSDAKILLSDSAAIPPASALWESQSLPDNWNLSRPGVGGFAWYRIEFELDAVRLPLYAIHVPKVSMNGAAFINGEFIGSGGSFAEPIARQWYRPQLYMVPRKLLTNGTNVIHYRIKTYANNTGGLSEIYFGAGGAVAEMWRSDYFWQVIALQMTSALTLGLSALVLLAWMLRRWNTAYGYYGAAVFLWCMRNIYFLARDLPVSAKVWETMATTLQVWVMVLIFMFILRFESLRMPRTERLVWGFCIATPLMLVAVDASQVTALTQVCYGALLILGVFILTVLSRALQRERSVDAVLLLAAAAVVLGIGAHDGMNYMGLLDFSEPFHLHFGAPILFVGVAWNMFKRFGKAQSEADELTQTLEQRVKEKTISLERSYELMRTVEAAHLRTLERERIMQDMHDGLGSQLISSLALAQSGELKPNQTYDLLRSCIDDLRLAIDTASETDDSLAMALGNLRFRMEPRLKAAGIALRWNALALQSTPDLPLNLPTNAHLPVLRVIQESITNALKHAKARTLSVTVACTAQALVVTIGDDGEGFDVTLSGQTGQGKGLHSLAKRARVLAAELEISSSDQGTQVRLVVPLRPPET